MTTRFYLPLTGSAPSSPSVSTGWMYSASNFARFPSAFTKIAATYSYATQAWPGATDETGYSCRVQYVSPPLDVDQTISGTVSAAMCGQESSIGADANLGYSVRVLQGDTSTERGVLKAPTFSGAELTTGGVTRIVNAVAVTTVNALAGDRIVIELGNRFVSPSVGATAGLLLANPNYDDLPLTDGTDPTNKCAWLELSTTITFNEALPPEATVAFTTDDAAVAAAAEISNIATVAFTTEDAVVAAEAVLEVDGSVAFTTDDAAVAAEGVVENAAAVEFTTDDAVVAATGDSGLPTATVEFTTDDATVAAAAEISNAATVGFTTDDAVVAATGSTTTAPPTERFSVTVTDAVTGAELTGLTTVYISVQRDSDGYQFDFTDNQFRALTVAAPGVPKLALDEFNVTDAPAVKNGYYYKSLQVLLWSGDITITIEYNDGTRINRWVQSSVEYLAGVRIKTGSRATPADVPSAAANAEAAVAASDAGTIDGAITRIEKERIELAEKLGNGTVPAGAGTYAFKAQDGTTTRVGGTVDANGVRTVTTVNGAP